MNGKKLKDLRIKNNIMQKDLADFLHISASTIGMYEQGRREPDFVTLKLIANYFKVSTDYLLDNENKNYPNEFKVIQDNCFKDYLINNKIISKDYSLSEKDVKNITDFLKNNIKYIIKSDK